MNEVSVDSELEHCWTVTKREGIKKEKERTISRILYSPYDEPWPFIWDSSRLPPLAIYPETSGGPPSNVSLFDFAPGGVYHAPRVTTRAVSSYLAISTLPGPYGPAVYFLWHFPRGHPQFALRTTLPCGVRTFLQPRDQRPCVRSL